MKSRIQITVLNLILMMFVITSRAALTLQPLSNEIAATNSLAELKINYPLVYNHLVHEFKDPHSLHYAVEANVLLIAFTSNNYKVLAVYSTIGEFRHSITDIGIELPLAITAQLEKNYPAYSVFNGKEIRADTNYMHQVVIENKDEYRLINVYDTQIEEVKRIKK